ncbi:MAG: 3-oxoacyl-[acyl-carrier-protein] synthase II [Limisphaerales bacterium]
MVVTGLGVVAPNGCELDSFWSSLTAGTSAASAITRFDPADLPAKIACEVTGFRASRHLEPARARKLELSIRYGVSAARMAYEDAGLSSGELDAQRVGVIEGSVASGIESAFKAQSVYAEKGYSSMSPYTVTNAFGTGGCVETAKELDCRGPVMALGTGGAAGNDAVGMALDMIRADRADVMFAGGTEAPLVAPLIGAFCQRNLLSTANDDPASAMKPFDANHDGSVLGEGAGYLVLEELSHALVRNARIYAEVVGYGTASEAQDSILPDEQGRGTSEAIGLALLQARLDPADIQYVNLDGMATEKHDLAEANGVQNAIGARAETIACSATKPVTGHLLGAAGAIESVITTLAIHRQEIPPTINHSVMADGCRLDLVTEGSRPYPVEAALNLNTGLGGKYSCIALKRFS